jgi:hypothetical protein
MLRPVVTSLNRKLNRKTITLMAVAIETSVCFLPQIASYMLTYFNLAGILELAKLEYTNITNSSLYSR